MDDAVLVRGRGRTRDVRGDAERGAGGEGAVGDDAGEVGPVDELHRVVRVLLESDADVEHADDAGVADARGDEGLGPELVPRGGALEDGLLHLHGDPPIEAMLDGLPDDAHAAAADGADEVVAGDDRLRLIDDLGRRKRGPCQGPSRHGRHLLRTVDAHGHGASVVVLHGWMVARLW